MKKLQLPIEFHAYQIALLYADEQQIKNVLGDPHYVETDSTRTCGGHEALWAYEVNGEPFAINCRIPYEESVIYTRNPKPIDVFEAIKQLFPAVKLEIYDEPHKI